MSRITRVIFSFLISFGLFFSMFFVLGQLNSIYYVKAKEKNIFFKNEEPMQLRPLTSEQINNFVKEKGITPLAVKNIKNYTVILHETSDAKGYYGLASTQDGNIKSVNIGSIRDNSNTTPVSTGLAGGSDNIDGAYSFYSFAWVIINDDTILNKSSWVTLTLDDSTGISESINRNKAIIIPNPMGNSRATNLIIYGKNREILFKQKL